MQNHKPGAQLGDGPAHPQVQPGKLFFEITCPQQDGRSAIEICNRRSWSYRRQKLRVESVVELGIEMRGYDDRSEEFAEGKSLFVCAAGATDSADLRADHFAKPVGDKVKRFSPRSFAEFAVLFDERSAQPMRRVDVLEAETVFVR